MDYKGFIGTGYDLRNFSYDCQTCINFYIEPNQSGEGKNGSQAQLISRPGLAPVIEGLNGPSRGGYFASNNKLYWVFGSVLYEITVGSGTSGWSARSRGNVGNDSMPVMMTDNSNDLFILSGGTVYFLNFTTNALTAASGGYYTNTSSLAFLDGRVIFSVENSNNFYWTELLSTVSNALDFSEADANPDKIVGLFVNSQQIWIFGKKATEIWYNYAQADRQYARQSNLLIETGLTSPYSVKKLGQTILWLGTDERGGAIVNMASGYNPQRVSTFPLEQKWQSFSASQLEAAVAETYQWGGHEFYVLNIPGADETWVFDFTATQQLGKPCWTTMTSSDGNGSTSRHLGQGHVFFKGYHVTGDYSKGTLYIFSEETFTDDGNYIVWERTAPHLSQEMVRIFYDQLTLLFLTGGTNDNVLDPQVMVQYSSDGGATWSDERWESCGKIGQYGLKVEVRRMGSGRDRVYRIRMTDPIYWAISGAAIDVRPGAH